MNSPGARNEVGRGPIPTEPGPERSLYGPIQVFSCKIGHVRAQLVGSEVRLCGSWFTMLSYAASSTQHSVFEMYIRGIMASLQVQSLASIDL